MEKLSFQCKKLLTSLDIDSACFNGFTSGTDVCGDQNFLLSVSEAIDDSGPLLHLHLSAKQRHLVAFSGQLACQPARSLPCLDQAENRVS